MFDLNVTFFCYEPISFNALRNWIQWGGALLSSESFIDRGALPCLSQASLSTPSSSSSFSKQKVTNLSAWFDLFSKIIRFNQRNRRWIVLDRSLCLYFDASPLSLRRARTVVRVGIAESDSWENKERLLLTRSQINRKSILSTQR